ncbi:GNAT family N-acetyltransferase [Peribacillus sp. B-H-3]|uniref:GNAT family N-acetyltransferase n=1 Tax=Peribacillus sp. B-H-3 TaxID=3400420 RepID=UPI003B0116AE
MMVNNTLTTDRLVLRPFELVEDMEEYASIAAQHEVGKWLPKRGAYTYEEAKSMMKHFIRHWDEEGFGPWALTKKDGTLIGHIGLNKISDLGEVELLYAIEKESWGKGYASEAAAASVSFAFYTLRLKKLIGLIKHDNDRSRRVLEKAGMTYVKEIRWRGMDLFYYELNCKNPRKDG